MLKRLAGDFTGHSSVEAVTKLSREAVQLVQEAARVDPDQVIDHHVIMLGNRFGGSGCTMHPTATEGLHPVRHAKFKMLCMACGVTDPWKFESEYLGRLLELSQTEFAMLNAHPVVRMLICALDMYYNSDGIAVPAKTTYHVPNEYVRKLAADNPDLFIPAVSIHPYRTDAIQELEHYASLGIRMVKWVPAAQGIDMSSALCRQFFIKMVTLNMVLIVHVGAGSAAGAGGFNNSLANPMLLRTPLDMGVKVLGLHCASKGSSSDPLGGSRSNFELFLRLLQNDAYRGQLYGSISGLTNRKRYKHLKQLLASPKALERLVYASDYPTPSLRFLTRPDKLAKDGFIPAAIVPQLTELYEANPLTYDYVLKRHIRTAQGKEFPVRAFTGNPFKVNWPPEPEDLHPEIPRSILAEGLARRAARKQRRQRRSGKKR